MINYARHDEEFYGIFKLTNGEEILSKALLTDDEGETILFLTNPVTLEIFTRETDDGKVAKGMGFSHWMQLSDEDFFIVREKDILSLATMSKETIIMYEAYINGETPVKPDRNRTSPQKEMGYLGSIDDARKILEKIYKNPNQP